MGKPKSNWKHLGGTVLYTDHIEVLKSQYGTTIYFFQQTEENKSKLFDQIVGVFGMSNEYFEKFIKKMKKEL
jgi:hypothetical protein